jgi:hypothetical protein
MALAEKNEFVAQGSAAGSETDPCLTKANAVGMRLLTVVVGIRMCRRQLMTNCGTYLAEVGNHV